ncbi:hypothetical protein [Alcanivorax sp.]|uniref:hypothetical protein n=1 Tax=Alcanivorax sp. TaxID=1872427 RepID=UPI0025C6705F|nr:hypothetical protein [Alcanivorax sp.]
MFSPYPGMKKPLKRLSQVIAAHEKGKMVCKKTHRTGLAGSGNRICDDYTGCGAQFPGAFLLLFAPH